MKWREQTPAGEEDISLALISTVWPNSPISSTIFPVLPGGVAFSCSETKQNRERKNNNLRWVPLDPPFCSERIWKGWGCPGHPCGEHHEHPGHRAAVLLLLSYCLPPVHPVRQRPSQVSRCPAPSPELSPPPRGFVVFFLKKSDIQVTANWHLLLQSLGKRARTAAVQPPEKHHPGTQRDDDEQRSPKPVHTYLKLLQVTHLE